MTAVTATPAGAAASSGRRTWLALAGAGALLVVVGLLARVDSQQSYPPYSPQSTDPEGAKALVELVEGFGAEVTVTDQQPPRTTDVALSLGWTIPETDDSVAAWRRWVRDGGTLVLTNWIEGLNAEPASLASSRAVSPVLEQGTCDAEIFSPVERVVVNSAGLGTGGYEVPAGATSCFGDGERAFAVVQELGAGRIISLGSPEVFTNDALDEGDNAVLATQLLVPDSGTRVAWLEYPETADAPTRSITDVMRPGVKLVLFQGIVAFVAFAFVRGRRIGAPIDEPLPAQIAGSELVEAYGQLLARSKDPARAAAVLRLDLVTRLAGRYGGAVERPDVVAEVVVQRTGVDRDRLVAALMGPPPPDDAALVRLADEISSLREETLHGTRT